MRNAPLTAGGIKSFVWTVYTLGVVKEATYSGRVTYILSPDVII